MQLQPKPRPPMKHLHNNSEEIQDDFDWDSLIAWQSGFCLPHDSIQEVYWISVACRHRSRISLHSPKQTWTTGRKHAKLNIDQYLGKTSYSEGPPLSLHPIFSCLTTHATLASEDGHWYIMIECSISIVKWLNVFWFLLIFCNCIPIWKSSQKLLDMYISSNWQRRLHMLIKHYKMNPCPSSSIQQH
jgi:hypothetical protein